MTPDGPSLFEIIWGSLLAAIGWIVALLRSSLKRTETKAEAALPKADFEKQIERRDHEYNKIRSDIKELFTRDDNIKEYLHAEMTSLRKEMNEGFTRLMDHLRER